MIYSLDITWSNIAKVLYTTFRTALALNIVTFWFYALNVFSLQDRFRLEYW